MTRLRSSGRSRGPVQTYRWVGIQFPLTVMASTTTSFNLVDSLEIDEMGGATVERIRGWISVVKNNVATSQYAFKIALENVDDAGAPTSDISPIDTDAEDVGRRQLWMRNSIFGSVTSLGAQLNQIDLEIDVKARVKMRAKQSLFLFAESGSSFVSTIGYLRVLLRT